MNLKIEYKNKLYFLEELYIDNNIYRRKLGRDFTDLNYNNFDELIAYIKLLTNDNYFLKNIIDYELTNKIIFPAKICLCGCSNCLSLFIVNHKKTNISFAVGSLCIKKFIPSFKSKLYKIKKNEICIICDEPLYFRNCKNHIKNADKKNYGYCINCWNS